MQSNPGSRRHRSTLRAAVLSTGAVLVLAATWRLRASFPDPSATPEALVDSACAWLAWVLAGYLEVAIAATALAHLITGLGHDGSRLTRVTPAPIRRLVDTAVTAGLAVALLGAAATDPAIAGTPRPGGHTSVVSRVQRAPGAALDWPGLPTIPAHPTSQPVSAAAGPAAAHSRTPHRHRAHVGLVSGGIAITRAASEGTGAVEAVRPGDSLWAIAARHLPPDASPLQITRSWHRWWAANLGVIGADPDLIYPGQRLRPPATPDRRPR
jgi:resuscitation-promoting factor RpfA